jgi:hypothetical protein
MGTLRDSIEALIEQGARAIARAKQVCERSALLSGQNKLARQTAQDRLDATRELIRLYRLAHVISGASDVCIPARLSVWIRPAGGAACDVCGKAIPHGEAEFVIGADDLRLDRRCYVDEMRHTR